jgi:hypothetical protein
LETSIDIQSAFQRSGYGRRISLSYFRDAFSAFALQPHWFHRMTTTESDADQSSGVLFASRTEKEE